MAKFEIMIPFILHCETGLAKRYTSLPYSEMFAIAKQTGYSDDPDDSGGKTMCGVTLQTYAAYRRACRKMSTTANDLKAISYGEWLQVLKGMFWDRCQADMIECQSVAHAIVDWTWMSGANAIKAVQRLLHVKADGIVGEKTLRAINNHADQHRLFDEIQAARHAYHSAIATSDRRKQKYLNGWRNRVNKIKWEGLEYA